MALDRGALAKIDGRVFAELDHGEGVQLVKVPLSDAVWSTWRRYCDALGLTMGQAIACLISYERAGVVGEEPEGDLFDLERASKDRMDQLAVRESKMDDRAAQLRRVEDLLREREGRLQRRSAAVSGARTVTRVGRNEPCPCGSGLKYKRCHGLSTSA